MYRALDRGYIDQEQFKSLYDQASIVGKKIGALMNVLDSSGYKPDYSKRENKHPRYDDENPDSHQN